MSKEPEDPEREERITDEIVVDCYDEHERWSGWWNYLEGQLSFPFIARSSIQSVETVLNKHEEVQVLSMHSPSGDALEPMRVEVKWQDRTFVAPLSEMEPVDADEETAEAVADWCYWVARGHLF